jgi:hypothetical protein
MHNSNLFKNEFKYPFEGCESQSHLLEFKFVKSNIVEKNVMEMI